MDTSEQVRGGADRTAGNAVIDMPVRGNDIADSGRMNGKGENIQDPLGDTPNGEGRGNQEIIVIDGRVYERVLKPEDKIYELNDIVQNGKEDISADGELNGAMARIVAETAERIAREMVPGIAERVIREEIEKLKRDHGMDS
jgi:hypothetical protein